MKSDAVTTSHYGVGYGKQFITRRDPRDGLLEEEEWTLLLGRKAGVNVMQERLSPELFCHCRRTWHDDGVSSPA